MSFERLQHGSEINGKVIIKTVLHKIHYEQFCNIIIFVCFIVCLFVCDFQTHLLELVHGLRLFIDFCNFLYIFKPIGSKWMGMVVVKMWALFHSLAFAQQQCCQNANLINGMVSLCSSLWKMCTALINVLEVVDSDGWSSPLATIANLNWRVCQLLVLI